MKYIGIDPGKHGAICVLNAKGHVTSLIDLPQTAQGIVDALKNAINPSTDDEGLTQRGEVVAVCVERVGCRPTDGLRALAGFMKGAGIIEGVCVALGFIVGLPTPQVWKKALGLIGKGKEGSIKRAQGLAPGVAFRRHDEAEAYLLARFAWLQGERWTDVAKELNGEGKNGAGISDEKTKKPRRASVKKGRGKRHATQKQCSDNASCDAQGDTGLLVVED